MKVGTLVGIILIVLGAVGLVLGRVSYTRSRAVMEAGPITVETRERRVVEIPDVLSGLAIVAGVALVLAVRRAR